MRYELRKGSHGKGLLVMRYVYTVDTLTNKPTGHRWHLDDEYKAQAMCDKMNELATKVEN